MNSPADSALDSEVHPAVERAIIAAGGMRQLAQLCKVNYQSIQKWRLSGMVPPLRVLDVERHTGVSRHDLRPDLYPRDSA